MELGHAYSVLVVSASAKFNESVRAFCRSGSIGRSRC